MEVIPGAVSPINTPPGLATAPPWPACDAVAAHARTKGAVRSTTSADSSTTSSVAITCISISSRRPRMRRGPAGGARWRHASCTSLTSRSACQTLTPHLMPDPTPICRLGGIGWEVGSRPLGEASVGDFVAVASTCFAVVQGPLVRCAAVRERGASSKNQVLQQPQALDLFSASRAA